MSLPLSSGITRPIAFAAPVEFGTISLQLLRGNDGGRLALRAIKSHLITSVSMDCSHDTTLDRSKIIQSLRHRSEAVRRAGCSGNNRIAGFEDLVVYIVYDSREVVASRSGDNNFLSACSDMCRSLFFGSVGTSI